jgi:hypothetical protein
MNRGWQHSGSFVVRFNPDTNPEFRKFYGKAEHVATGKIIRFNSIEELFDFFSQTLQETRQRFDEADTIAE